MPRQKLIDLREVITFLKLIPDSVFFDLNSEEFVIPGKKINKLREGLERKLDHYVMTYNRRVFKKNIPAKQHLCFTLKGARLTGKQKQLLVKYEQKVKEDNVSFVVYQKPMEFIFP